MAVLKSLRQRRSFSSPTPRKQDEKPLLRSKLNGWHRERPSFLRLFGGAPFFVDDMVEPFWLGAPIWPKQKTGRLGPIAD